MLSSKSFLYCLALGAFVLACDHKSENRSPDKNLYKQEFPEGDEGFSNIIEKFQAVDSTCLADRTNRTFNDFNASTYNGVDYILEAASIPSLQSKDGKVSSKHVSVVQVGEEIDITNINGKEQTNTRVQGVNLNICNLSTDDSSTEFQALSTLRHIHETAAFFEQKSSITLPAVEIVFAPTRRVKVKSALSDGSTYERYYYKADNATYGEKDNTLTFYPRSRFVGRDGNLQDYQMQRVGSSKFVTHHEYGHHIFKHRALTRASSSLKSDLTRLKYIWKNNGPLDLPEELKDKKSVQYLSLTDTQSEIDKIHLNIGAINEGFADIYSYLSNNEAPELTKGFLPLEVSRDPESSKLKNDLRYKGASKSLTSSVMSSFFASNTIYSDIHIIGAIYAHGMKRLFDTVSSENKILILTKWLSLLNPVFFEVDGVMTLNNTDKIKQRSDSYLLKQALVTFVEALSLDSLNQEQCSVLKEVFPGLVSIEGQNIRVSHQNLLNKSFTCQ